MANEKPLKPYNSPLQQSNPQPMEPIQGGALGASEDKLPQSIVRGEGRIWKNSKIADTLKEYRQVYIDAGFIPEQVDTILDKVGVFNTVGQLKAYINIAQEVLSKVDMDFASNTLFNRDVLQQIANYLGDRDPSQQEMRKFVEQYVQYGNKLGQQQQQNQPLPTDLPQPSQTSTFDPNVNQGSIGVRG